MQKLNTNQERTYYRLSQDGRLPYAIHDGFPFYESWVKDKKYATINKEGKIIHFGHPKYEHYEDKIGLFSDLDHNDPKRRSAFKARHEENRKMKGQRHYLLWLSFALFTFFSFSFSLFFFAFFVFASVSNQLTK